MKLRIRGNSIRLRVTKTEASCLAEGIPVTETLCFGNDSKLVYVLTPSSEHPEITARFRNQTIEVLVPREALLDWAVSPDEISLKNSPGLPGPSPAILIEKDFFCLKPRSHELEDESDLFQNPNHSHGRCGG